MHFVSSVVGRGLGLRIRVRLKFRVISVNSFNLRPYFLAIAIGPLALLSQAKAKRTAFFTSCFETTGGRIRPNSDFHAEVVLGKELGLGV